jgi:hypothetical protein
LVVFVYFSYRRRKKEGDPNSDRRINVIVILLLEKRKENSRKAQKVNLQKKKKKERKESIYKNQFQGITEKKKSLVKVGKENFASQNEGQKPGPKEFQWE